MIEIQFIGTGDAFCSGGRRNSAIVVRSSGKTMLLDCGPTTMHGLQSFGVDPREIDVIAVSHFHGDHASGIPFLLLDYLFEHPRTTPLQILGPPGIEEYTTGGCQQFHFDSEIEKTYPISFREFECGAKLEAAGFSIRPVAAQHHPDTRPHMLHISTESGALFFSGDTGWHEALPGHVSDVDLFISECTLLEESFEFHLSHERLVKEQKHFDCRRIILTHLGSDMLANLDRVQFDVADDGKKVRI